MLIRIYLRPNLINPFFLIIWTTLRQADIRILSDFFDLTQKYILLILLFFGEFMAGLILFIYRLKFYGKKNFITKRKDSKSSIQLIQGEASIKKLDSDLKIFFLIFITSYLDFVEIVLCNSYLPKFYNLSVSIFFRFYCILTIISSLFMHFLLKIKILKHQYYSLIIIGICLILIIITEFSFQKIDQLLSYGEFMLAIFYLILIHFFLALLDCIEKYLYEYDYADQFKVLMIQGFLGVIISPFYYIKENPLIEIKQIYNNNSTGMFILFIFLLCMYSLLTGLKNIYRVTTNKLFSPVAKSLADYIINPFYIIYYYIVKNDFSDKNGRNIYFFLINLILALIINFWGLVYNEFIILFFWGLEHETHREISKRAIVKEIVSEFDEEDDNSIKFEEEDDSSIMN